MTIGSPYCSKYRSAARVISGDVWLVLVFILTSLTHKASSGQSTRDTHTCVMPTGMAGEESRCHRGNLEQDEAGDKAKHEQPRHDRNQSLRCVNIGRATCQIGDEQVTHNAHR